MCSNLHPRGSREGTPQKAYYTDSLEKAVNIAVEWPVSER